MFESKGGCHKNGVPALKEVTPPHPSISTPFALFAVLSNAEKWLPFVRKYNNGLAKKIYV